MYDSGLLKIKCEDGVYQEFDQAIEDGHQVKSGDELLLYVTDQRIDK